MYPWQQFLLEQGARLDQGAPPGVTDFGTIVTRETAAAGFIAPLTDLGLLAFSGEEAAHFLHNQLTNDVEHLASTEARLAGYCSPKGRLLATLLMWRSADAVILQVPREIQAALQKRLQMFILRAKVKQVDINEQQAILGIGGQAAGAILANWFASLPSEPYAKVDAEAGTLIRVADGFGFPRYQWIATVDQAKTAWPKLQQALQPVGPSWWRLADIQAGVPQVMQQTQDKFVPQMVNFEVIGGVNFKKGCYPGQEIVARSQYLGKLKRRMILASVQADAAHAGMEVFSSADPEQPCGMVVNAEPCSPQEMALLVEIKTASAEAGTIHLGSATGPVLALQALPYALPDAAGAAE